MNINTSHLDRDLKPGNILVSKDCKLRITDFGLARFVDEATAIGENSLNPLTEYVVTRYNFFMMTFGFSERIDFFPPFYREMLVLLSMCTQ
jgi:serine/threonine protein kinase